MLIVDTSVLIDFLNARPNLQTNWLRREGFRRHIGITTLIQTEVLQGVGTEWRFLEILDILNQFEIFEAGSRELAVASARNYRVLRRGGFAVRNTIDCLIATFCIDGEHELLHNDRDFDAFEVRLGLKVIHPSQDFLN